MDAADLERQTRTLSGCIPTAAVARLLELGHEQEVELQAGQGEWFCVRAWAQLLGERGRQDSAREVLAPYVATGWWRAARFQAELLEGWGRAQEAIALTRPYARAGDRMALDFVGRLLARHDRGAEAFELLRAGVEDWFLATALVDVAEAAGRDEDAAALLTAWIPADHRCDTPWCCRGGLDADTALGLLAKIRERQGRIEEAIALLRTRHITSVNGRDQLAELLARHGRIEDLRAYAALDDHGHAAQRLAEVLEERGDVEGAIAVYQHEEVSSTRRYHDPVLLAGLLSRHGRGDEAIAVMCALVDSPGGAEDWIVDTLCTLYAEHGRAQEGLAHLDALKARRDGEEEWDFFRLRLPLMADCGLLDEAIEQARAHREGDTGYAAWSLSDLLAEAGRTEEAVAVLEQYPGFNSPVLAQRLIDLGRINDAVRVLQNRPSAEPAADPWARTYSNEPPF
ncbi:tetratricopeptide repeat protein [Kitasatospora cineracea]|uniref:tetratricopeptide repeat protein n=1 Tax=Kitasatospora cineracea TaxID=88074 RepID=UPI00379E7EB8